MTTDRRRREVLVRALQGRRRARVATVEVVEAYEGYWRKTLLVKRVVLKSVPTVTGHPFISPYEDLRLK
jgi:hypothetical protein